MKNYEDLRFVSCFYYVFFCWALPRSGPNLGHFRVLGRSQVSPNGETTGYLVERSPNNLVPLELGDPNPLVLDFVVC